MLSRKLRCEALEDRCLLAILGVEATLYEDPGDGSVGAAIADDTVTLGDQFYLAIDVQDIREQVSRPGVHGLSLDIQYDPAVLQNVDEPFDPTAEDSLLVTQAFPRHRGGTLDAETGFIDELSGIEIGALGDAGPIGAEGMEQFALLHFEAIGEMEGSPITITVGDLGVGMTYYGPWQDGDAVIDAQTVTVENPPPIIGLVPGSGNAGVVQFTTEVVEDGEVVFTSPLVRPAMPDTKQYVNIVNTGESDLVISDIIFNAPDVALSEEAAADLADGGIVVAPGAVQALPLVYAPTDPTLCDNTTQSFLMSDGMVIVSNAENMPELEVTLAGESTFNADVNLDGTVNLPDMVFIDEAFGLTSADPEYSPFVDVNGDGDCGWKDFGYFGMTYGLSRPEIPPLFPSTPIGGEEDPIEEVIDEVAPGVATALAHVPADSTAAGVLAALDSLHKDEEEAVTSTLPLFSPVYDW